MIRDYASNQTDTWSDYHSQLWRLSYSFLLPNGVISKLVGFYPTLILLMSVVVGSALVGLTTVVLCRHVRTSTALVFGSIFALMPSQVLWSTLLLKDAYIALGFVGIYLILQKLTFANQAKAVLLGLCSITALLIYVQRIRVHSLVVVCIALVLTHLITRPKQLGRLLVFSALMVVLPWTIGGGPAGIHFLQTLSSGMSDQRVAGAINAKTAVVAPIPVVNEPGTVNEPGMVNEPAEPGTAERLIDEIRYLPSGLKVMLLDPMPSQLDKSKSLYFAFAEHLLWYPLLALAFYGALWRRKWTSELVYAALLFLGLSAMWGLAEGNFGTAFRHRTEFVWVVIVFAAIGADRLRDKHSQKQIVQDPCLISENQT
jgi:hypothetical protein